MKITLNLSIAPSPRERYALTWAVPTSILGLIGLVVLSFLAVRNFREYRSARRELVELRELEAKMRAHEAEVKRDLEHPRLNEMFREVQFLNTVITQKQSSLPELAEKVSKLLPGQTRLESLVLTHAAKDPTVRLSLSGNSEQDIEQFLENLENSPDFTDVVVTSQGVEQESAEGGGKEPINVTCTARYHPVQAP